MASPPERTELDDLSLARVRKGDALACRALVARYERPVFALLSRMVGGQGRALVEDLAQETFLRVFRALPGFDPAGTARLSSWILTIATRLAIDELRRRRPTIEPLDGVRTVAAEATPDGVHAAQLRRAIERALGELPAGQRAVFVLREHHELEYDEIARALELDLNTVKSRLFRARTALRAALAEVHGAA